MMSESTDLVPVHHAVRSADGPESQISEISHRLTETSKNVSQAADEAEQTEKIVGGLQTALETIEDVELLLASMGDQMSLLAVQTALSGNGEANQPENLVHLSQKRLGEDQDNGVGQSIADRIDTLQTGSKRSIRAIQDIGRTINSVNDMAKILATSASKDALEAATVLLRQSEDLRAMLDGLLEKVSNQVEVTSTEDSA